MRLHIHDITHSRHFLRHLMPVVISVLALILGACADDLIDGPFRTTEEQGNVILYVPSVKGVAAATRADVSDPEKGEAVAEGTVKSLRLYAFPDDGGEGKSFVLGEPATLTQEYSTYTLTLDPGAYRMYLTGNLDPYLEKKLDASTDEETLKALLLGFSAEKMPNLSDGLPMAAFPTDIQEHTDGLVTIPAMRGATVTADMKFLCSKVRMTLFFNSDGDGYSGAGFNGRYPIFSAFDLQNVADATFADSGKTPSHGLFVTMGELDRMEYPEGLETEDDVRTFPGEDLDKMARLDEGESGTTASRMAWRTTLYLPENMASDKNKATRLILNSTLDGTDRKTLYRVLLPGLAESADGADAARALERGMFHDLTACLKDPADEFEVNVRVEPWTVLSLVHELHGPYHLRVEKTENVPVTAGEETHLWYSSDVPVHFESEKATVDGRTIDVLKVETMKGHANDSIVITANPALPLNYDLSESYFHIIAGNIKKKIRIWPFTIQPFFKVTPTYSAVEVREMIESGANTHDLPIHFTTNLQKVSVRLKDGWDETGMPVEFKLSGECTEQDGTGATYEGMLAHDGYNTVSMRGFVEGNSYWADNHVLTLEYTAYNDDGTVFGEPQTVEIEVFPRRYQYRIYFRPESDDWVNPHVYICQILALPKTLDKTKVKDSYVERAARPVGGHLYTNKTSAVDMKSWEGGLQYSYTGKISFRGWSTQGGPECNDPYEAVEFNPITESQGFYVFGNATNANGNKGYGVKYIPPASRQGWGDSGGSETAIRERYDIDTDLMAAHRAKLTELCPLCVSQTQYNMKFPGIRMLMSEKHPGWWYVDLTEVAEPGKTLIMFFDGHQSTNTLKGWEDRYENVQVPGAYEPGIPLFDFADNEGWLYYRGEQRPNFTDDKPAVSSGFSTDTYRLYWPAKGNSGLGVTLLTPDGTKTRSQLLQTDGSGTYHNYNQEFDYVEFKLSGKVASRSILAEIQTLLGDNWLRILRLSDFTTGSDGVRSYTLTDSPATSHSGKPASAEQGAIRYRLYWPHSANVIGLNAWLGGTLNWVFNNYDNSSNEIIPGMTYISGNETMGDRNYDYLEFYLQDDESLKGGWQMHFTYGTYQNQMNLTFGMFTDPSGKGFRAVYRDSNWTVHQGTPPDPQGNRYRVYWPKTYEKDGSVTEIPCAWIWGVPDETGEWTNGSWLDVNADMSSVKTMRVEGIDYYCYDFVDDGKDNRFITENAPGIIPRSVAVWGQGIQPNSQNIHFYKYSFQYSKARGINEIFVKPDFKGLQ